MLRYSLGRRQRTFTRLVARASMFGMVLGVASLITVMSVMNGFADELYGRLLALVPHATTHAAEGQLDDWGSVASTLRGEHPRITGVAPYISDEILVSSWSGQQRPARLSGVDLAAQRDVNALHNQIVAGQLSALEETRFSVVIGSALARILGVTVGDTLTATTPALSVTPLGVFPRVAQLQVVALFEVGADLDSRQAWVSLDTARRLLLRSGVDGLQVRFADLAAIDEDMATLRQLLPPGLAAADWRTSQGSLFSAVAMEKVMVSVLLMAVIAVAAFNIVSTLTMSVTEKRGDIAVLRVMGFSAQQIMLVFVGHGVLLGGVGVAVGAVMGVLLATNVGALATWLESVFNTPLFDPSVYYIGRLPSVLQWSDVSFTLCAAMILCVLASLYPAWRAASIHPIEALNHG